MLQNISISALFTFIKAVFKVAKVEVGLGILAKMLEYIMEAKRFVWAKGEVKGLVWDLSVTGIGSMTADHIMAL